MTWAVLNLMAGGWNIEQPPAGFLLTSCCSYVIYHPTTPPYLSIYPASGSFNHLLCYTDFAKVEGLLLLWGGGVRRQL